MVVFLPLARPSLHRLQHIPVPTHTALLNPCRSGRQRLKTIAGIRLLKEYIRIPRSLSGISKIEVFFFTSSLFSALTEGYGRGLQVMHPAPGDACAELVRLFGPLSLPCLFRWYSGLEALACTFLCSLFLPYPSHLWIASTLANPILPR